MIKTKALPLSCTIPSDLSRKLDFISNLEERSKSYYVKKALQNYLEDKFENVVLSKMAESEYEKLLESEDELIDYEEIRRDLDL